MCAHAGTYLEVSHSVERPNVFLLVVDSLRADAVFGDHVATPHMDSIAANGVSFTQCVCTSTTTTPSFSSILTGCYPPKHGVRGLQGYRLSPSLTTMAETFAGAGYETHAEVTGPLVPETGVLRGFEQAHHRRAYKVPFFGWRDTVLERMSSYARPWFMLLHIWEVHRPYRSPPDFAKRKDRAGYEAAITATDAWLRPVLDAAGQDAVVIVTGDHGEDYPETRAGFEMVRASRGVRRYGKVARWSPFLDRKLAGLEIGHGFALYEHLVRVPLILSGPGVARARVTAQVRHIDLLPTIADLAGVPIPTGVDGRSLRPLMEGRELSEEPAYMEAVGVKLKGHRVEGVRTPQWKLVRSAGSRPALYRLDGDARPNERRNHYASQSDVARGLEAYMEHVMTLGSTEADSGMSSDEEAVVEQHLRDLGYL
jgi:arylsulfatase A-like enzyme